MRTQPNPTPVSSSPSLRDRRKPAWFRAREIARILPRLTVLALAIVTLLPLVRAAEKDPIQECFRSLRREPGNPVALEELKRRLPAITDPAARETALATCALGLLHNENTPEAEKALKALNTQFPASPHLTLLRFDELDRQCRRCDGRKTTLTANCVKCLGGRRCLVCDGRGFQKILNQKRVDCSACTATGRCPLCKGVGRTPEPCKECRGRGSILDHRKVRQTAVGILHEYLKGQAGGDPAPEPEDRGRAR